MCNLKECEKRVLLFIESLFAESDLTLLIYLPLPDKPSVTIQQCSTPVTEGGNATLFCNATGNPVPNTAWIRGGEVVSYTKRLVIENISLSEAGGYECLAWNGVGNNDTKSCKVDVQCKLVHCCFLKEECFDLKFDCCGGHMSPHVAISVVRHHITAVCTFSLSFTHPHVHFLSCTVYNKQRRQNHV